MRTYNKCDKDNGTAQCHTQNFAFLLFRDVFWLDWFFDACSCISSPREENFILTSKKYEKCPFSVDSIIPFWFWIFHFSLFNGFHQILCSRSQVFVQTRLVKPTTDFRWKNAHINRFNKSFSWTFSTFHVCSPWHNSNSKYRSQIHKSTKQQNQTLLSKRAYGR